MDRISANLCIFLFLVVFQGIPFLVSGDDVTHDDGSLHNSPACNNKFKLVRGVWILNVTWINVTLGCFFLSPSWNSLALRFS